MTKATRNLPTPELLRALLEYNPGSGELTWKARSIGDRPNWWNSMYAGRKAGTARPDGYIHVKVLNRNLQAHRVIWAMTYGCWPECIDHRNGDPSDNRISNLRAVSRTINQRNQKRHCRNTSGVPGVHFSKAPQKWLASIKIGGKSIHLGLFDEKGDAVDARRAAERRYNFTGRL